MFHDFWVGFSDALIALEMGFILIFCLRKSWSEWGIFLGTWISAGFGAIFHWFFPEKIATTGGLVVWYLVAAWFVLILSGMLHHIYELVEKYTTGKYPKYIKIHLISIAVFILFFVFSDKRFYNLLVPYLVLAWALMIVWIYLAWYSPKLRGCIYIALWSVVLSIISGLVQNSTVFFWYHLANTLYHLLQGIGLMLLAYYFYELRKYQYKI